MEKNRKKIYKKALLLFFAVMAVFTIVSRAADSITIPGVEVEKAEKGRITYSLNGSGTIKATVKNTYLIPAGFLVEFCQEDSTGVEAGEVLIRFQQEYLEQRKQELETELEKAKLQLKQARLNQAEDAWIGSEESAQKALEKIQSEYQQAQVTRQQVESEYNYSLAVLNQDMETIRQQAEQEREQTGEEVYQQVLQEAEARLQQEKAALETKLLEADIQLAQADKNLIQAQDDLEAARKSDEVIRKNGEKAEQIAGYNAERVQLDVEIAEKNLKETEELMDREGIICAEEKGIFLNTTVTEGMKTTGSEFISIGTGGFEFTAEVSKEAGEKIAEGDTISVKIPGKEVLEVSVNRIMSAEKQEENTTEETVILKAKLPEETYAADGYAAFSVKKESEEEYQNILPLTAIRQDSKGYYCLGIRTQNSVLGEEIKAERINITLLNKDNTQAAVQGAIQPDTEIIITSEKDILAGDRVRVKK